MPEERRARQRGGRQLTNGLVDLVGVALGTGCRIGELLGLRWPDIDIDASPPYLTVRTTVVQTSHHGLIRQPTPKTDSGRRIVVLPTSSSTFSAG